MNATHISDSALIDRSARGDKAAVDSLVQRHMPRVLSHAMRLSHDREIAEDVVADTFVRMNRALSTFSGRSAFTTWLYRLTKNCYLDIRKKSLTRATESLDQPSLVDLGQLERLFGSKSENPYEIAERNARGRVLMTAVRQLSFSQQSLIVMYHVNMLTYEEISDNMKVPLGTVKSRLHRARRALRQILGPNEFLLGSPLASSRL